MDVYLSMLFELQYSLKRFSKFLFWWINITHNTKHMWWENYVFQLPTLICNQFQIHLSSLNIQLSKSNVCQYVSKKWKSVFSLWWRDHKYSTTFFVKHRKKTLWQILDWTKNMVGVNGSFAFCTTYLMSGTLFICIKYWGQERKARLSFKAIIVCEKCGSYSDDIESLTSHTVFSI